MLTYQDLVNDMASGCKPRSGWRIGTEHEQFVYNLKTGEPLPYDGAPGIKQILEAFITEYGWNGHEKNGYLVELERGGDLVTLEPGGQVELASAPYATLADLKSHADAFYKELTSLGTKLGFGILARGTHPHWTRAQIKWMPKERYRLMGPYMEKRSQHGVDMMILTCGTQINLDFESEADMVTKYRVALGLQPLVTALMANSRTVQGKDSGYESFRSFIWTETDPDRCGVPEFVFDEGMSFARYVDYALDVPMYMIVREDEHLDMLGKSFRDFMEGKLSSHTSETATIEDWHYHLTTVFTEVRLKSYLEFRGPDSTEPPLVYAMTAFWTGIMYDPDALAGAAELIKGWTGADHTRIRNDVPKLGLDTMLPDGRPLRDLATQALALAAQGLDGFEAGTRDWLIPFQSRLNS